MKWMTRLRVRLGQLLWYRAADARMDEEIRFHIEMETEKNHRAGMGLREARRRALIAFGGIEAHRSALRDGRRWVLVEDLWQDVRHGVRSLRSDLSWTAFAVLIVAVGIGASVTVFSLVNALLLRPLPFNEPEPLVWIANAASEDVSPTLEKDLSALTVQVVHVQTLQAASRSLADVAGFSQFYGLGDHHLTEAGEPERLTGVPVTANFFALLGVQPYVGRGFTVEESTWGGPKAVLLSHQFWTRRFGSDPSIVGRTITIDREPVTVAGVLPESFDFGTVFAPGRRIDFFSPFPLSAETNRQGNTLALVGRLASGVTLEAAQHEVAALVERAGRDDGSNEFVPRLRGLREHVSGGFRPALLVLSGAVGLVMLIVCANLSNLLLARAAAREKEFAVRAALGAGRGRLIRQMLTESMLLSCAGAIPAVILAYGGTQLVARTSALSLPLLEHVTVDRVALGFALATALVTGMAFGLMSALRVSTLDLHEAVKDASRGSSAGRRHGLVRGALVVSEVALACMLLVGAGLLMRSLVRVLDVDLGFQPQGAISVRIDPSARFPSRELRTAYYDDALRRLRAAPGIQATGLTDALPLGWTRQWTVPAPRRGDAEARALVFVRVVSEDYVRAMGIPVRAGRDFVSSDDASGRLVVLVNETLAHVLSPGEDPLGRMVSVCCVLHDGEWRRADREVVGVVADTRHQTLEDGSGSELYLPLRQTGDYAAVHAIVRGALGPVGLASAVRSALGPLDPTLPTTEVRVIRDLVDRSVSPRRLVVSLLMGFAAFALVLASLGIYGVISYGVAQRRRELGIRIALGASAKSLSRHILAQTMKLATVGIVLGLTASWALARSIKTLLFGITFSDPTTFAAAIAILAIVAALAGYLPARRAARADPMDALRAI